MKIRIIELQIKQQGMAFVSMSVICPFILLVTLKFPTKFPMLHKQQWNNTFILSELGRYQPILVLKFVPGISNQFFQNFVLYLLS